MRRSLCSALLPGCATALLLSAAPVLAGNVTDGQASHGGLYWQKVTGSGKVQYICRSNKEPGIQKNARCQGARAVKP
jgi:hypothetical protein